MTTLPNVVKTFRTVTVKGDAYGLGRGAYQGRRGRRLKESVLQVGIAIGLLTAPAHVWAFANPTLARALRRRGKGLQGESIHATLAQTKHGEFLQALDDVYRTGVPFYNREVRLRAGGRAKAKPEEIRWKFSCLPMRNEQGEIWALCLYGWRAKAGRGADENNDRQIRMEFEGADNGRAFLWEAHRNQMNSPPDLSQQGRDEERMRISRELHDSTGQLLTSLSLNLCQAIDSCSNPATNEKLRQSLRLIDEMADELHAIAHSLRPPLLEQRGLEGAIEHVAETVSAESGVQVQLDVSAGLGNLTPDQESTIFRVVQEGLTNVQRHSQSPTAAVGIRRVGGEIRVEVRDQGKGFSGAAGSSNNSAGSGLGVKGMQERLRLLGGRLHIQSSGSGTTLLAVLPARVVAFRATAGAGASRT